MCILSCFFIIVAMLISNYITDHPNSEHQDQWQSCLSAIVTDYHKNLDPSKGDSLQLGRGKKFVYPLCSQGHPTSIFGKYLFGRRFEI